MQISTALHRFRQPRLPAAWPGAGKDGREPIADGLEPSFRFSGFRDTARDLAHAPCAT